MKMSKMTTDARHAQRTHRGRRDEALAAELEHAQEKYVYAIASARVASRRLCEASEELSGASTTLAGLVGGFRVA